MLRIFKTLTQFLNYFKMSLRFFSEFQHRSRITTEPLQAGSSKSIEPGLLLCIMARTRHLKGSSHDHKRPNNLGFSFFKTTEKVRMFSKQFFLSQIFKI